MKSIDFTKFWVFLLAFAAMHLGSDRLAAMGEEESQADDVGGVSWSMPVTESAKLTFQQGGRLLIEAVKQRNVFEVGELLGRGIHPDSIDDDGRTALMYAIQMGDMPMIGTLLRAGVNINAADRMGKTALVYASERPDMGWPPAGSCPLRKRIVRRLLGRKTKEPRSVLVPQLKGKQPVQVNDRFEDLPFTSNAHQEEGIGQRIVGILIAHGAQTMNSGQKKTLSKEAKGRVRNVSVFEGTKEAFGW